MTSTFSSRRGQCLRIVALHVVAELGSIDQGCQGALDTLRDELSCLATQHIVRIVKLTAF